MLLAEIRIIYKNPDLLHTLLWNESAKEDYINVHKALKAKSTDPNVKQAVEDALSLIGEEWNDSLKNTK